MERREGWREGKSGERERRSEREREREGEYYRRCEGGRWREREEGSVMSSKPYPTNHKPLTWSEVVVYSQCSTEDSCLGALMRLDTYSRHIGNRANETLEEVILCEGVEM